MATTRSSHDPDDSSSFTGTIDSTSSSSTVPGPGAITGRFLKILGEKSLDLVVFMIIRNRLKAIERTLEKSPHTLSHPTGDKEQKRLNDAYNDLSELCLESRSDYYPLSFQRGAAKLIQDITVIKRLGHDQPEINPSPFHETWEALLVSVEHLLRPQATPETVEGPSPLARPAPRRPAPKILLLGAGEVGKSTLMKQICRFNPHDAETCRNTIISDTIASLLQIFSVLSPLDSKVKQTTFEQAKHAFQHIRNGDPLHIISGTIWLLFQDPAVRHVVRKLRLGMLSEPTFESIDYFLNSAYRIFRSDYTPTHEDIVRCRIRTLGISEFSFYVRGDRWSMVDTGGQRSERKKWINCFENATAIVFVVALSDYNKTLIEEASVNRMEESLVLFESIVNSRWFTTTSIFLLFNKFDLFVEKLPIVPLEDYFPDYTGEDVDDACKYFEHRFLSVVEDKKRTVVVEYGTAINTEEIRVIFESIQDKISQHDERNMTVSETVPVHV